MAHKKSEKKGSDSEISIEVIKAYLISDIRRVASEKDTKNPSRDFYRSHGKFSDAAYSKVFGDFSEFKRAAFISGWEYEDRVTPTKEDFISDFQNTLKKFLSDSAEGEVSVQDMTKKYYDANSFLSGFLQEFYSNYTEAKKEIILQTYGPTRNDLDHLKKVHKKERNIETFIFTAVMPASKLYLPGYKSIQTCMKKTGAILRILPMRGLHHKHTHYEEEVAALSEYFVTELIISDNLEAKDVKAYATMPYPLTGKSIEIAKLKGRSAIIAHPKQHLRTLPVRDLEKPQTALTTGYITTREWFNTESHYLAQRKSVLGGVIVEIDHKENLFFARHFQFAEDGSFADKGVRYYPDGRVTAAEVAHLTVGDYHSGHTEKHALEATYDMIKKLKVPRVSLHDVMDGQSLNPYEVNDIVAQTTRPEWAKSLESELHLLGKNLTEFIKNIPKGVQVDIVASNHDEFLSRYIRTERFKGDPVNAPVAWELAAAMVKHYRESNGKEVLNPVQYWIEKHYPALKGKINWFKIDDICRITPKQIDIANHGHKGPKGSRGTVRNYKISIGPCNIGHHHEPEVLDDVWVAGTLARYFEYNRGQPSGAQNANILTYADGSRQILWISKDGKWHL
jgi:hypothetical protein